MSLFDRIHDTIRGDSERQLQVKVDNFILKKGKLGQVWEAEDFIQDKGRFSGKRWHVVMRRVNADE